MWKQWNFVAFCSFFLGSITRQKAFGEIIEGNLSFQLLKFVNIWKLKPAKIFKLELYTFQMLHRNESFMNCYMIFQTQAQYSWNFYLVNNLWTFYWICIQRGLQQSLQLQSQQWQESSCKGDNKFSNLHKDHIHHQKTKFMKGLDHLNEV